VSIKLMAKVWDYSQASGNDLLVLLVLADMANDEGECWPSMATIARKSRLNVRNARLRIRSLEEMEEVLVIHGGGAASSRGGLRSNRYRVTIHITDEDDTDASDLIGIRMPATGSGQDDTDASDLQIRSAATGLIRSVATAESPEEPPLKLPLNPQPKAGDHKPTRHGMRGTGTSPRERQAAEGQARAAVAADAEADRLVVAIPEKYAHCPEDYVVDKIGQAFPDDADRRKAALSHYRDLKMAS
jgi:hypothetical protein